MAEHPVLIPTARGLLGGIVTDPDEDGLASALLLQGRSNHRSGVNRMWARAGRALALLGVTVLRVDYPGIGDSHAASGGRDWSDVESLREVLAWFRERAGRQGVMALGSCYGTRLAVFLAGTDPHIQALGLVVPELGASARTDLAGRARMFVTRRLGGRRPLDRRLASAFEVAAMRMPTFVLEGELELQNAAEFSSLVRRLARRGARIDVEIVPHEALHSFGTPRSQDQALDRLVRWVRELVGARAVR